MGYLSKIEAAIKLGVGIELLEYFVKNCPKQGEKQKLETMESAGGILFDEAKLNEFSRYLNKPWPKPASGRPTIPSKIKDDIKIESHHACAICGHMDNGEIAHIEPVKDTLNNSPDNLIYLCPNHHTKYDYGYKSSSNLTIEEIRAAKMLKRNSRRRMMRLEANVTSTFLSLLKLNAEIEKKLQSEKDGSTLRQVYLTEAQNLITIIPKIMQEVSESAKDDKPITDTEALINKYAPKIAQIVETSTNQPIQKTVNEIVAETENLIIDLDEVECPRCNGTGVTGLVGDLCGYCKGSCFVTQEEANNYDESEIEEVECPRCGGSGQTGRVGDLCKYCKGSCFVTQEEANNYDESEIDEVECPRCGGSGQTGRVGDLCKYCGGSCFVTQEEANNYDESEIDEVECPRCGGSGQTGRVGDLCKYCGGSCFVPREKAMDYDESEIDEVECPRCGGSGQTGRVGDLCKLCKGSCFVSKEIAEEYDKRYNR